MLQKVILVPIIAVIIGGGIFFGVLYSGIWSPSWSPFNTDPAKVLAEAASNLDKLNSLKFQGNAMVSGAFTIQNNNVPLNFSLKIETSGFADGLKQKKDKKKDVNFQIGVGTGGIKLSLAGEAKTLSDITYLKFTELPQIPTLAMMGINLSSLQGKWMKIDPKSMTELTQNYNLGKTNKATGTSTLNEEQALEKKLADKFTKEFTDLLKASMLKIVHFEKKLKSEKIDGQATYHYLLTIDKKELEIFLEKFFNNITLTPSLFDVPGSKAKWDKFVAEFPSDYDKFSQGAGKLDFEIWISKKNKFIKKISFKKDINPNAFTTSSQEKSIWKSIVISLNFRFSNFNKQFELEIPKNAELIQKVFEKIFPVQNLIQSIGGLESTSSLPFQSGYPGK